MDKLTALSVKGEAFLLRRVGYTVLVDSGYGAKPLIAAISKLNEPIQHVDIAVCTHADNDHAGGFTTLLDKGRLTVGEFWLPGSWSEWVPRLLLQPEAALVTVVDDLRRMSREFPQAFEGEGPRSLANVLKSAAARELPGPNEARAQELRRTAARELPPERRELPEQRRRILGERGNDLPRPVLARPEESEQLGRLRELREEIAEASHDMPRRILNAKASVRRIARSRGLNSQWQSYWLTLIDTAARIRKIAEQAIKHDVPIRWFDYSCFATSGGASGGIDPLLTPINAVELIEPPPLTVSFWAFLSVVNQESLVFVSSTRGGADVLFSADSPLGSGANFEKSFFEDHRFCRHGLVVTAPHHGSQSNAIAYGHMERASCRPALFVRSGGKSTHPGRTFRELPPAQRVCVHCPYRGYKHRQAEILLSASYWHHGNLRISGHECDC